jgi:hypothetical protein
MAATAPAPAQGRKVTPEESKEHLLALQQTVGHLLRAVNLTRLEQRPEAQEALRRQIERRYDAAKRIYETYADLKDPKILPEDDADATWFMQRAEGAYKSVFGEGVNPVKEAGA